MVLLESPAAGMGMNGLWHTLPAIGACKKKIYKNVMIFSARTKSKPLCFSLSNFDFYFTIAADFYWIGAMFSCWIPTSYLLPRFPPFKLSLGHSCTLTYLHMSRLEKGGGQTLKHNIRSILATKKLILTWLRRFFLIFCYMTLFK